MSISKFQKQASTIQKRAKEMKINLSYAQALELIAHQNGYKTWNALKTTEENKPKTVASFWESKGVNYASISKLIDLFPEKHEVSETAKDLISLLDDHSFESIPNNLKNDNKKETNKRKNMEVELFLDYDKLAEVGNDRDSDVYARMCGVLADQEVCRVILNKGKPDQVILSLCSAGEQRISMDCEEDIEDIINNANKSELFNENERKVMLEMLKKSDLGFSMNSWYEARITYKSIDDKYESEIGLEGVWESVSSFLDYFNNEQNRCNYIKWLEEYDGEID